jgi:16S rRNA (guanine966-N2)-methyltransferase
MSSFLFKFLQILITSSVLITSFKTISQQSLFSDRSLIINAEKQVQPQLQTKRIIPQGKPRLQELNNPNRLRILGGIAKGRKIDSPDVYLRPMMSKVREAIFNSLAHFELFTTKDAHVLDMFAGAGSVGLESLSRGAKHATFVDFSKECISTVKNNAKKCGFMDDQISTVVAKVEDVLSNPESFGLQAKYDFVSLTPPYREVSYSLLCNLLCATTLIKEDGLVLLEYPVEMGTLPGIIGDHQELIGLRNRRYGRTVLALYVYKPTRLYDVRVEEFEQNFKRK